MDEQISTTVEAPETQTTQTTVEDAQPETQTTEQAANEPVNQEAETTETESQEQTEAKEEPPKDWEKIAKDNQASFTKISQEKAELTKRVAQLEEQLKPKIVQEGKINPEFEQRCKMEIDNAEFLEYDSLARALEPETRAVVENLLNEARRLYNPANKSAYESKLNQVRDYFRTDLVIDIEKRKEKQLGQIETRFKEEIQKEKQIRADRVANAIEQVPELKELVYPESENYSPEVFGIVKTIFDFTGDVDIQNTTSAINKIKELGVKEYLAKQSAIKASEKANVPSGETVIQKSTTDGITAEYAEKNYQKCLDQYIKKGLSFNDAMKKVDEIIMKG